MKARTAAFLFFVSSVLVSLSVAAQKKDYWKDFSTPDLFEMVCNTCHSTALPKMQRLTREHWEWVISDMINDQGCNFLPDEHMQRILDYLVENYGPTKEHNGPRF